MGLIKYQNTRPSFPYGFGSLWDNFFENSLTKDFSEKNFVPSVDVLENEKEYEIQVAVPGVDKKDVSIDINDNHLTISGERKIETKKEEKDFRSIETSYGKFERTFLIPKDVNKEKIEAKYTNGMLNIVLHKEEVKDLSKSIDIK